MNKLIQFWSDLRSSFWFMPALMVTGSIVFAAEGARQMLSTLY